MQFASQLYILNLNLKRYIYDMDVQTCQLATLYMHGTMHVSEIQLASYSLKITYNHNYVYVAIAIAKNFDDVAIYSYNDPLLEQFFIVVNSQEDIVLNPNSELLYSVLSNQGIIYSLRHLSQMSVAIATFPFGILIKNNRTGNYEVAFFTPVQGPIKGRVNLLK